MESSDEAHRELLLQEFQIAPIVSAFFPADILEKLTSRGCWLSALASGELTPSTSAQKKFLRVVEFREAPSSAFEYLWLRYCFASSVCEAIVAMQKKDISFGQNLFQLSQTSRASYSGSIEQYTVSLGALLEDCKVKVGKSCPADRPYIIELLKAGALIRHALSTYELGVMYEYGLHVPRSTAVAEKYYKIAAELGNKEAIDKLIDFTPGFVESGIKVYSGTGNRATQALRIGDTYVGDSKDDFSMF
jgi:hypothetical protein